MLAERTLALGGLRVHVGVPRRPVLGSEHAVPVPHLHLHVEEYVVAVDEGAEHFGRVLGIARVVLLHELDNAERSVGQVRLMLDVVGTKVFRPPVELAVDDHVLVEVEDQLPVLLYTSS